MNIVIRKYEMTDYFMVHDLLKEVFDVEKVNNSNNDNYIEFVAVVDDKVVGYALLTRVLNYVKNSNYYLLDYVCVNENYRNKGIGKELLKEVSKEASIDGEYIELTSSYKREAAHHVYEELGYIKKESNIFRKVF